MCKIRSLASWYGKLILAASHQTLEIWSLDQDLINFTMEGNFLIGEMIFDSFAMFYYVNGRTPTQTVIFLCLMEKLHLEILARSWSSKNFSPSFFQSKSNGLVLSPFLAALLLFFEGKETSVKNFLIELYRNLRCCPPITTLSLKLVLSSAYLQR